MKIEIQILPEPMLEFGGGMRGESPKQTLPKAGPFLVGPGEGIVTMPLGLIGPKSEIPKVVDWFEKMKRLLVSNESNALRYPRFPGIEATFRTRFEFVPRFVQPLGRELDLALAQPNLHHRFDDLLKLYTDAVSALCSDAGPRCIIVCFPEEVAALSIENRALSMVERRRLERLKDDEHQEQLSLFDQTEDRVKVEEIMPRVDELLVRYFHRAFKARCMGLPNAIPTQVIRTQTYSPPEGKERQSEATRAWNLGVALLYKTGNIPWRPADLDEQTCFAGISFHHLKKRGSSLMYSSVAHAFSNSVEPFILKGAPIPHQQTWRKQPYLKPEQAAEIARLLIDGYAHRTGSPPNRLVIHKTSQFQPDEERAFVDATKSSVPNTSLVWMRPTGFRLLRRGVQEPFRGTLCRVGGERSFLFTTGYVPWWEEYPGPHIPAPLEIGADDVEARSREILALTKMNWNTADGIGRFPITLAFARRVGMIMAELDEDALPNPSYRFYM